MQTAHPNLTHIQLNGNTQLQIGLTGICVKPMTLASRSHSQNPPRLGKQSSQNQQGEIKPLAIQGQSSLTQISQADSQKELSIGLKSIIAQKKTSASFSSRIVLRAKNKNQPENYNIQQPQNNFLPPRPLKEKKVSLSFESPPLLEEMMTPTRQNLLPPLKAPVTLKSGGQLTNNEEENQRTNGATLNIRIKENQIAKKKNFDFLERTKVKNQNEETDLQKLHLYFRSKTSCLISGAGRKQYYLSFLKNMKDLTTKVKTYEKNVKIITLNLQDVMNKLKKIVATRSKYKYREKIDFEKSIIMRTLGYESREIIQRIKENMAQEVEEYEDLEDEGDREQEEANKKKMENDKVQRKDLISPEIIANWKKMRGYSPDQKVFIVVGQYSNLKSYLKEEGWVENPNNESLVFDLKWVTKKKDVDRDVLLDQQITNHFQKNHHLTSKSGLALNLRNLIWYNNIDIDTFFPRCFDLSDVQDFEDFIEEFKYTHAESVLKLFLQSSQDKSNVDKYQRLKLLISCAIIKRRTLEFEQKVSSIPLVVLPEEWSILNARDNNSEYLESQPQVYLKLIEQLKKEIEEEDFDAKDLGETCQKYVQLSQDYDPQFPLNIKNSWIVKPAGLSRGRGIRAFDQLEPLINYIMGKDVMWVAQKYMENPMTINRKKFDIRQWVLVTEWNPLTIYFYDTCYIRICFDEYNPTDLHNKFAHLANNCISKHAENFEEKINDTMMFMEEFVEYIQQREGGNDIFHSKIQKKMMEIAISSIKSCKDCIEPRRNSLELYGYDFMVDDQYNTWLLEINSSPSMEFSTPVTTKLVKMCLQDTAKIIQEHFIIADKKFKKDQDFGLWKNIYRESK